MEEFKKQYKQLNAEQKRAVDTIDGPVLVIAGPGTGKTQLISTRVANILLKEDIQPKNILCLTFTESAAHEMRQRLINVIGQSAYNVTISTYHAFGSELLQRFPEYFGSMPDMRAIDELGIHNIISDIIDDLEYKNPLKKGSYFIRDIISTVSDFKLALLTPKDLQKIAKNNLTFIETASKLTKNNLAGIVRISTKSVPSFEKLAVATRKLTAEQFVLPGVLSMAHLWQQQLDDALADFSVNGKTTSITAWKNTWLARDGQANFIASGEQTALKLLALADIYQKYLKVLESKNLYDYDDMVLQAIKGLETYPDLKFTLQEQYAHILLDEFQDTNSAQLKLVKLLSDNPLYENRPNVMAVGDDDQAIYAFQGADYSHMLTFNSMYKDVELITLTKNYRSHEDILSVAHNVAGQISERLDEHLSEINKILSAEAKHLPQKAAIARHEFKSDVAQYGWVAKQITSLIKKGVNPSEIAVLAPQHRYLEPLIPYLRQVKLPVRYEKRENVLEDTHILQLLRMSELVLAIAGGETSLADSLWPEVLSYDFWQLPTELIWQISWDAHDQKASISRLLMKLEQTKPIARFFAKLANISRVETLENMLDYLIGVQPLSTSRQEPYACPYYEYYFSKSKRNSDVSGFWHLLSNLTVLRQHIRDYASISEQQLRLNDLVQFAQEHENAGIKVLNTSPYHESSEAVQVMTAYKAKGLEFEHVFVLACVDEVWGSKANSQNNKVPLPQNLNFVRYQGADEDERLRLFYVALTRAKHGLYLASYLNNFANKPTTRLKFLNEIERGSSVISQALPERAQKVIQSDKGTPEISELSAYWQAKHATPAAITSLKELLQARMDRYQLSPTHLNSFIDLEHSGPEEFFINTILRFPKAPAAYNEFGKAIHETLEWAHVQQRSKGKLPTKTQILKAFDKKLFEKQLSQRDYKQLLKRGQDCLELFIKQRLANFKPENEHEFNFSNQGVFVGDAHLSGKIDQLIIDKKKHKITIVDFKTGKSQPRWQKSTKMHKYMQQLYMYKILVEGSFEYSDYSVVDAYLEFVEPDENGKIVDLHVKFDSRELQRMKKLIIATWKRIKELNMPDVSAYPKNYQGVVSFEEDLIKEDSKNGKSKNT